MDVQRALVRMDLLADRAQFSLRGSAAAMGTGVGARGMGGMGGIGGMGMMGGTLGRGSRFQQHGGMGSGWAVENPVEWAIWGKYVLKNCYVPGT